MILINELKLKKTNKFGNWNAKFEKTAVPAVATITMRYTAVALGVMPLIKIKFKKKMKMTNRYIEVYMKTDT